MYQTTQKIPLFFLIATLAIAILAIPIAFASPITVTTNKTSYLVGESVSVSGTAAASAQISIQIWDPEGNRVGVAQTQAGADGSYSAANIWKIKATDKPGAWKVSAYDAVTKDTAEATFTFSVGKLTTVTISVAPVKAVYGSEDINIEVSGDAPIASAVIQVTQSGATMVTVPSVPDVTGAKMSGTYTISTGFDGPATIQVTAKDAVGNQVQASKTIQIQTVSPDVAQLKKDVADLQTRIKALEDKNTALETTVNDLKTKVSGLESSVSTLSGQVSSLDTAIATQSGKIDTLNTQVSDLSAKVAGLGTPMLVWAAIGLAVVAIIIAIIAIAMKPKAAKA